MDKPVASNNHSRDVREVIVKINLNAIISNAGMIRAHDHHVIQMLQEVSKNHVSHVIQTPHQESHDHHVIQMHQGTIKGKGHLVIRMHQEVIKDLVSHVIQMRHQESHVHLAIRTHQEVIKDLANHVLHVIRMHHRESNNLLVSRANHVILTHHAMKKGADRDATGTETVIVTGDLVRKAENVLLKIIRQNDI